MAGRHGGGASRIVDCPGHRGGSGPCCFAACRSCSSCRIAERIEKACTAKQLAEARGKRGGDVVFLVCEKTGDTAPIERAGALLLGNRAHDKRT